MPTLNWIGKDKVVNHHLDVPIRVLDKQYTFGDNADGNMIIHGDNLDALKALLPQFEGKVKCIYIDPPYNTGNEGWVYNDNVNDPKIRKWLGEVVGREGEDLSRHDKWLCMMYPRLKLLQKLLAEDGAIFISIDDSEIANLKLICNEIFGQNNHVVTFIWQKRYLPDVRTSISDAHEFVLCYASNPEVFKESRHLLPLTEAQTKQFSNPDNDPRGPWKANDFTAPGFRPNQMYEITLPSGRVVTPPSGRCWRVTKESYNQFIAENRMVYGNKGDGVPAVKRFLSEMPGMVPWTWWNYEEVGHTQEGNNASQEELPSKLIIISDMEFDACVGGASAINFENARGKYEACGYQLPRVVFWNVASRTRQQPVTMNEQGVTLVSGVTPRIFSMVAEGAISPFAFMMKVLSSERYACIAA